MQKLSTGDHVEVTSTGGHGTIKYFLGRIDVPSKAAVQHSDGKIRIYRIEHLRKT